MLILTIAAPVALAAFWFWAGIEFAKARHVAPTHDELGSSVRATLQRMIIQGRLSGPNVVVEQAAEVKIDGVVVTLRYKLETDQFPPAKEVEGRR